MDRIQVTDELLYRYMPGLEEKLLDTYPTEQEIAHEFTAEFYERMQKLLKRARQKEKYGVPVTTWRRVAAVLSIVTISSLTVSLSVEAVRQKLYDFVQTIYESYTEFLFSSEEEKVGEFVPLYPEYIPKGYELAIGDVGDTHSFLSYENKEQGRSVFVQQDQITDGLLMAVDNEYIVKESYPKLGEEGQLCYKEEGTIRAVWKTENCLYMVSATDLPREEILKICESLK